MLEYNDYVSMRDEHGKHSSFAVWGDDIKDLSPITAENEEQYVARGIGDLLGTDVVLVALNWGGSHQQRGGLSERPFEAFHLTYNDTKLRALVEAAPALHGALIADLFIAYPESKGPEVLDSWRRGEAAPSPDVFFEQVRLLGDPPTFVVMGEAAQEVWDVEFASKLPPSARTVPITHYAAQGKLGSPEAYVERAVSELRQFGFPLD